MDDAVIGIWFLILAVFGAAEMRRRDEPKRRRREWQERFRK